MSDKKRLLLLVGAVLALGLVYVAIHGVPGSGGSGDDEASPVGPGTFGGAGTSGDGPAASGREAPARYAEVKARRNEVVGIAIQKDPERLGELKKAAADADWRVRHAAVDGVGLLGEKGDPQFLIRVLSDRAEQAEVRAAAAERLGDMRYWDAGPAIIDAMEDESDMLRERAGVALRRLTVVDFDFHATDEPAKRAATVQRIRELWPWFYQRFSGKKKAQG